MSVVVVGGNDRMATDTRISASHITARQRFSRRCLPTLKISLAHPI